METIIKIFGGSIDSKNNEQNINKFSILPVAPPDISYANDTRINMKTVEIEYTNIINASNEGQAFNFSKAKILLNKYDNKLYISIDYIYSLLNGINGYKAELTKDGTFPSASYNGKKVGYFGNNKYYVYD